MLCDQEQETAVHLSLECVYAREVWLLMKDWSVGLVQVPEPGLEIEDWWKASISQLPKEDRSRATHVYGLEHLEGKELDDC